MMMLDASTLAAQLRHPHGDAAQAVAESMNRSNGALNRAAIGLLAVTSGERVLEIGPGNAAFAPLLLQATDSRYLGIELSTAMVEAGNRQLAAAGLAERAGMRHGDAHALPIADAAMDAALAVNTLYFWPDLAPVLDELARVVRRGAGYAWPSAMPPSCAACRSPPISSCTNWMRWSWRCVSPGSAFPPGAATAKPRPATMARPATSTSICCWHSGAEPARLTAW